MTNLRERLDALAVALEERGRRKNQSAEESNYHDYTCGKDAGCADGLFWAASRIRGELSKATSNERRTVASYNLVGFWEVRMPVSDVTMGKVFSVDNKTFRAMDQWGHTLGDFADLDRAAVAIFDQFQRLMQGCEPIGEVTHAGELRDET